MLCHLITGLRQFHNYMSSVTYYLIIEAFISTFCVYDILSFHVHVHVHVHVHISVRFHVSYPIQVSCLFHVAFQILIKEYRCIHTSVMYSCPSLHLLFLEIGIIPIE